MSETADEFTVVADGSAEPESKVAFDTIGDEFIGTFLGTRTIPNADGSYVQYRFKQDGTNEICFINANYNLREGMQNVRAGTKVRIRYVSDVDTGMAQPMRTFEVAVAKRKPVTR